MLSEAFPQQLAGLIAALTGMMVGSVMPQFVSDHKGHVHHYEWFPRGPGLYLARYMYARPSPWL